MRIFGLVCAAGLAASASAGFAADDKVTSCTHQASVVAAVQQARLDRVKERKVQAHVIAAATWPKEFNTAIPLVTPWVYEMRMKDVRTQNLAAAWQEMCLQQ